MSLATDLGSLEQAIVSTGAILVVIDPISAYLGMANSYRDSEVRSILAPLHALAERTGAAIWGVMHLTKDQQRQALYRGQGSIAFVGAARLVLAVGADPADSSGARRFLMPVKSNVCAPAATLAYRIVSAGERGRLTWEANAVEGVDVNAVLAPHRPDEAQSRRAEAFLCDILQSGPMLTDEVQKAARAHDISDRTLYRAKKALAVESEHIGFGRSSKWYWRLPAPKIATDAESASKIATSPHVATFEQPPAKRLDFSRVDPKIATEQDVATVGEQPPTIGSRRGASVSGAVSPVALIYELKQRGITLAAEGAHLRVRPSSRLTPEFRAALVALKPDVWAVVWRVDAMRRHGIDPTGNRAHPDRPPVAVARWPGCGAPGICLSCGECLGHPDGVGRCAPCDIASDLFYASLTRDEQAALSA